MIQDVKLGTHRIATYMYAISKCAFLLGFRFVATPLSTPTLLDFLMIFF